MGRPTASFPCLAKDKTVLTLYPGLISIFLKNNSPSSGAKFCYDWGHHENYEQVEVKSAPFLKKKSIPVIGIEALKIAFSLTMILIY